MENILLSVTVGSAKDDYNDRTGAFFGLYVYPIFTISIPALRNLLIANGVDPADVSIAAEEGAVTNVKSLYDSGVTEAVINYHMLSDDDGMYATPISLKIAYPES